MNDFILDMFSNIVCVSACFFFCGNGKEIHIPVLNVKRMHQESSTTNEMYKCNHTMVTHSVLSSHHKSEPQNHGIFRTLHSTSMFLLMMLIEKMIEVAFW